MRIWFADLWIDMDSNEMTSVVKTRSLPKVEVKDHIPAQT